MNENIIKSYVEFRDGYARIAGRQLKAELVARMHVDAAAPIEEVMRQYQLTRSQVHAALAYYYENQIQLDDAYRSAIRAGYENGAVDSSDMRDIIERRRSNDQR